MNHNRIAAVLLGLSILAGYAQTFAADPSTTLPARPEKATDERPKLIAKVVAIRARVMIVSIALLEKGVVPGNAPDNLNFRLQGLLSEQLRASAPIGRIVIRCVFGGMPSEAQVDNPAELDALERDPTWTELRHDVDELELAYADTVSGYGDASARAKALKHRLDAMTEKLAVVERDVKLRAAAQARVDAENERAAAEAEAKNGNRRIAEIRAEIVQVTHLQNEYASLKRELAKVEWRIDHPAETEPAAR